jgi:hypothetical protein
MHRQKLAQKDFPENKPFVWVAWSFSFLGSEMRPEHSGAEDSWWLGKFSYP